MPNVLGGGGVNCILRNIRCVIADALEVPRDKYQIQITTELFRVMRHAVDELTAYLSIHLVEFFVTRDQRPAGLRVFPNVGINRITNTSGNAGCWFNLRALRAILVAWSAMRSRLPLSFMAETTRRRSDATG